jgi:hypothetical protein
MKKIAVFVVLALGCSLVAQAQDDSDKLLEKLLILQFAEEASLDSYTTAEFLTGYAEYRSAMDALEARQAEARTALEASLNSGNSSDIATKMRALMSADKAIFYAIQAGVSEASALLNTADVAKLYLAVSNMEAAKQEMRLKMCASAPESCPLAAAEEASVAAEASAKSPEEEVMAQVKALVADVVAGNADKLLDYVSEDFEHYQVGDKAALAMYLQMGKDMGYIDDFPQWVKDNDGKISLDDAEVELKDGEAIVYPIDASSAMGSVSVELVFKKDADGVWRISTADADGI